MAMRARTLVFVLIAAVLVVVTAPGSGTAQETQSPLVGGAWALQFRVSENFTLSTFEGSVVSLKRHYSPSTALRLGVSLAPVASKGPLMETECTAGWVRR